MKPDELIETSSSVAAGSGPSGALPLVLAGAFTTALALVGVHVANAADVNVMGWYVNYMIPAGAIAVGLVASSGFGLSAWHTGTRATGRLLVIMMAMLGVGYLLAQYLEFRELFPDGATRADGTPVGFWGYFDVTTRAFQWAPKHPDDDPGTPFGTFGYVMRALEIAGFVAGGLVAPLVMRKKPYCEPCRRYKRTRQIALVPASVPPKRFLLDRAAKRAAHEASGAAALAEGQSRVAAIFEAAAHGDTAAVQQQLVDAAPRPRRKVAKLPRRISIELVACRGCAEGHLRAFDLSGHGNQLRRVPLTQIPVDRDLVASLAGRATLPTARVLPRA